MITGVYPADTKFEVVWESYWKIMLENKQAFTVYDVWGMYYYFKGVYAE